MLSGTQLISSERQEQLTIHGRTIDLDVAINKHGQLAEAARNLSIPDSIKQHLKSKDTVPLGWNLKDWSRMFNKSYKERLIIAGALLAAEIDRIQAEYRKSTP